jgi:hypothetical protein
MPVRRTPCSQQRKHLRHFYKWPRRDPPPRERLNGPKAQHNRDSHRLASPRRRRSRALRNQPRATPRPVVPLFLAKGSQPMRCVPVIKGKNSCRRTSMRGSGPSAGGLIQTSPGTRTPWCSTQPGSMDYLDTSA